MTATPAGQPAPPAEARRILFTAVRKAEWERVPLPAPDALGPTQVLLRSECSVVSAGTETANYAGTHIDFQQPGRRVPIPFRPGYALAGRVERVSGEPREIVDELASRGYRHLYIDGGVTIQRFLDAGLIDRMIISRLPVIIGRGIPLFGPTQQDIWLEHVSTRAFTRGMVQSEYRVRRS